MKGIAKKLLAIFFAATAMFIIVSPDASALTAYELADQITIAGFTATVSGNTVTVTGDAPITRTLSLDISAGVKVIWKADVTSSAKVYLFDISGGGEFEVRDCTILSTGTRTSGAISVSGASTITVESGGSVLAERIGNPILITAGGVTVNVNAGGTVRSLTSNSNAAIQINNNVSPVIINVNGGAIISDTSGFGINDGSGTSPTSNLTNINVNAGVVTASSNSAIHMTGMNSKVTVSGGVVSNSASNNFNPVIDMVGDMGGVSNPSITAPNVTVTGIGVVECTSQSGYTIQTRGNVLIAGNAQILANAGRAINLVGLNSVATVRGNALVLGRGANVISTATTDNLIASVANAKVIIEGGSVINSGLGDSNAINVTGENSSVTVSGGIVTASGSGNTINAGTSASNATVNVILVGVDTIGGHVSATGTGDAIYVSGTAARTAVTVSGGQVTAGTGLAINIRGASVTLDLNGGFVFAYGTLLTDVIHATNVTTPQHLGTYGKIVCAWDGSPGEAHLQGTHENLTLWTGSFGTNVFWHNHPGMEGGINYVNGPYATGFFPLPVTIPNDYGLIFDSDTGYMYKDVSGNGIIDQPDDTRFLTGSFAFTGNPAWVGLPGRLELNSFSWVTGSPTALTIIGNTPTTIAAKNDSVFESTSIGASTGIRIRDGIELTISGEATLSARGYGPGGIGLDLGTGSLNINSGTFIAQGRDRAIDLAGGGQGSAAKSGPAGTLYSWKWSKNFDGSGINQAESAAGGDWNEGTSTESTFEFYASDKFVRLRALTPVSFTAEQIGGISGIADSVAILLTFSTSIDAGNLSISDINVINGTGNVVTGTLAGSGNSWVLTLNNVGSEGLVDVEIGDFGAFYVSQKVFPDVPVYKASIFNLSVYPDSEDANAGGIVTGDITGEYFAGAQICAHAVPDEGYHFTGWTINGATIPNGEMAKPAMFIMPSNDVTLTASFAPNPSTNTLNIYSNIGGVTSGTSSGAYFAGHDINVTAVPDEGYYFTGWSVTGVAVTDVSAVSLGFQMPENTVSLTANFAPINLYNLTVNSVAGGLTFGNETQLYQAGTPISVSAVADDGYHFTGWSVDGVSIEGGNFANSADFSMPANNVTLTANFAVNPNDTYTLNVIAEENGTIHGTQSGAYNEDEPISVTAVPNDGFHFTGWTEIRAGITTNIGADVNPYDFLMPAESVTLTANFAPVTLYNLAVTSAGGGLVVDVSGQYRAGASINVSAEPDPGYHFTDWVITGASLTRGNTVKPAIFNMPANDVTLTATFAPNPVTYTLNVVSEGSGNVVGTTSGAYLKGHPVNVIAEPSSGYHFTGWTSTSTGVISNAAAGTLDFAMLGERVTVVANFSPNNYNLTVSSMVGGTVSGTQGGIHYTDELIFLTANPMTGYRFIGWTAAGVTIPGGNTANPARFSMSPNDVSLTANFELIFDDTNEIDPPDNPSDDTPKQNPPDDTHDNNPSDETSDDKTQSDEPSISSNDTVPQTGTPGNLALLIMFSVGAAIVAGAEVYRRKSINNLH